MRTHKVKTASLILGRNVIVSVLDVNGSTFAVWCFATVHFDLGVRILFVVCRVRDVVVDKLTPA